MAYLGASPVVGEFRKLDDISAQFNDSNVTFTLSADGQSVLIGTPQSVLISLDGIIQEPGSAYILANAGSAVTFTEAPNASSSFFAVQLGTIGQVGTPSDGTVSTAKIQDGAITEVKIADGAITAAKIADGTVVAAEIADGNVTTAKLADSAVTESKIADANVTTSKIVDNNVTSLKLSPNLIFRGTTTFLGASVERANVISSNITANVDIDNQDNGIVYYTENSTSNVDITLNLINMDSIAVGNTTSFVLIVTNNVDFQSYVGNVQINGQTGNVIKWLGGVPTSGTANLDLYSFSVIKTDSSAYTTLASKNEFQ